MLVFLRCVVVCCALFVSSIAFGGDVTGIVGSSALSGLAGDKQESKSKGLFFLADDFSQMKILPSFTFGAPSGFVPGFGTVFVGVSAVANGVQSEGMDGAMALGGGFGDPVKAIGGYASLSAGSISPADGGAFDRGSLGLGLGHTFASLGLGVSAGVSTIDLWHNKSMNEIADPSFYGAVSKLFANDYAPVILTAGVGNMAYGNVNEKSEKDRKYSAQEFLAAAVYVLPQLSLVADYTAGITTTGVSIVPCPNYPVVIGFAANDILTQDNGINALVTVGFGYAF